MDCIHIFTILLFQFFETTSGFSLFNGIIPDKFNTYAIKENKIFEQAIGYNKDATENFTVIAESRGYKTEQHTVVTEDGYILTMFRISVGKNCTGQVKGTPILMMHGLLDTSDTFIIAGPGVGLAYILADQGYDVWCGNNRGNRYSRSHTTLDPDCDGAYWDFTFDQIGTFDLPAMIDYVLNKTATAKLNYIGHSQGTTIFFILASTRTQYNDKIQLAICLAPVAWMYNMFNPLLQFVAQATPELLVLGGLLGVKEIFGHQQAAAVLIKFICQYVPRSGCGPGMLLLAGHVATETSTETIRALTGHYPSGTSANNLGHFGQGLLVDQFRRYDYGEGKNLAVYGAKEPPCFDVTQIKTQVALFCGKNDWMVSFKDVAKLRPLLPNLVQCTVLDPENWSHLDFVWGDRIPVDLSPKVMECLDKNG